MSYDPRRSQFDRWLSEDGRYFWSMDMALAEEGLFEARMAAQTLGDVAIGMFSTTIQSGRRGRAHIALDGRECLSLSINTGLGPLWVDSRSGETVIEPGAAVLLSGADPFALGGTGRTSCIQVVVPPEHVHQLGNRPADLLGQRIDSRAISLRTLRDYCRILAQSDPPPSSNVAALASSNILDLLRITLDTDVGRMSTSGLRAARLASVLEQIRIGYTRPEFSARIVARELHLSTRYVQDLLAESGSTFAERVLELRLQEVYSHLTDRRTPYASVSDLAYAAGFGDISYFNRCFRRRFGCSPGEARRTTSF